VLQAQEITDRVDKKPYHTNALGISNVIKPTLGKTVIESVQQNIDNVRAAGGVPQINHPNFGWALTAEQIQKLKNVNLMEIHNGHPLVNNLGGGGQPGAEEIWDALLSSGKLIYGIGSDDAHHFIRFDDRKLATPGHAWVLVRAQNLTAEAILKALDTGDFYASTGVELKDYQADARSITIDIREKTNSKYTVQFIGRHGKVLKTEIANPAIYKIRGDEGYVRAKIIESNGTYAWTQPVMLKKK